MSKVKVLSLSAVVLAAVVAFWMPSGRTEDGGRAPSAAIPVARAAAPTAVSAAPAVSASTNQTPTVRGTLPFVLTSREPFTKPLRLAAEALGARTAEVVSRHALLVEADEATRVRLSADARFESVQEYLPDGKVQPELAALLSDGAETVDVSIVSLSAEDRQLVIACLQSGGGEMLTGCFNEGATIRAKLPAALVAELAMRGDVRWLEKFERPHLMNDKAVEPRAMNVRAVWNTHGLTGAGQKISTSDSGIDTGDTAPIHVDLRNRVKGMYFVSGCDHYDANGHGTHTSGSIVGEGTASGGQYRGTAYGAELYAWFCGKGSRSVYTPDSVADMFRPEGVTARIHSASWGSDVYGQYTSTCAEIDTYVWQNPEFLPVFSAGNEGSSSCTIGSPGSAKNVLTVGAMLSLPNDPASVASFSSRGPCCDGRIKPDVGSPGSPVWSTRSSLDGNSVTNGYTSMSGTSMACPLTAGSVALVRQWLVERKGFPDTDGRRPTAALMKAVISGGGKDVTVPNLDKGWGRVDLAETLFPSNRAVKLVDRIPFGQGFVTNIVIETTNAAPLDVQLVWVDYAGSSSAAQATSRLVNDLNLSVATPGGNSAWLGNGGTVPDALNNVESVRIPRAAAAKYVITVDCKTILHDHTEGGAAALYIRGAFDPNASSSVDWVRTETVGGVTWSYVVSGGTASVGDVTARAVPTATSGAIAIPSKLGGYPVTGIAAYGFAGCTGLTAVTIPSGVTSIGASAFYGCTGLTAVTIPAGVTSIGTAAFANCSRLTAISVNSANTAYASVDGVLYNKSLTTLVACPGAKTAVTIRSDVTSIAAGAFDGCGALRTVNVEPCDVERVRALIRQSGGSVSSLTFVEMWDTSLSISPDRLAEGAVGTDYSVTFTAAGGTQPYVWQLVEPGTTGGYVESRETSTFEASGTAQGWCYDDKCWTYILPFAFPFYGKTYTRAYVSSNGTVAFDDAFSGFSESLSELKNHAMIAAMWDDLTTASGNIYVTKTATAVTFRWQGAYYSSSGTGGAVNFSVTLSSNGRIRLSYGTGNSDGGLVGVSAGDGENYRVCACSQTGSLANAEDVILVQPGVLPDGLAFSEGGVLSGLPEEASSNTVDVMVTDAQGKRNHREYTLVIRGVPEYVGTNVVDGVEWHYRVRGGRATVGVSTSERAVPTTTSGAITVPSTLGGYPVTGISASAFSGCTGLVSVVVSPSVTSIGASAFYGCTRLASVAIPSSVTSIGTSAFGNCSAVRDVTIPACVTKLSTAFPAAYSSITNVVICEGATSVGEEAFYSCSSLQSVTIPSSVTSIGNLAFYSCSALASVTIPSSVRSIGNHAFYYCSGLTSLPLSSGVTSIGTFAFCGCSKLTSVSVPASVTSIGAAAFANCGKLTVIAVDSANTAYVSVDGVLYNKSRTMLWACPAAKTSVTIESSVKTIAARAFYYCSALASLTIPSGVTGIGEYAFFGCGGLTTMSIPAGVTGIGTAAFANCSKLTAISVNSANTAYASVDGVLYNKSLTTLVACPGAKTAVTIPSSVTSIGNYAFHSCSGLTAVTVPSSVTSIGNYAFYSCRGLTSVTIPSSVTSIGSYAFYSCSGLRTVTIPSPTVSIGSYAFTGCTAIRDVTIHAGVTRLNTAFPSAYSSITNVVVCEGVSSIPSQAFSGCSRLKSITIPPSVTSVGSSAFYNCSALRTVYVAAGDAARVRTLLSQSGASVAALTFVESWDTSLSVSPDELPEGMAGEAYSVAFTAAGGTQPYAWNLIESAVTNGYRETRTASTFTESGVAQNWCYDDKCWTYILPFAFPFYGKTYTVAYVSSNGTLTFDGLFTDWSESLEELQSRVMIAGMWDDLTTSSGNIYVTKTTDAVTFRWQGSYHSGTAVNFSVTLSADGRIRLSYGSGNASGGLVGISAGDGLNYRVCSCSQTGSLANAQDVVIEEDSTSYGLPEGLELSSDGVISGTPEEPSTNVIDVMVTDAQGRKNHKEYTLVIRESLGRPCTTVVDGVEWHYRVRKGRVTVGVSPAEGAVPMSTSGAIAIPPTLGGSPVVGIGESAFCYCTGLTSVSIPPGVTSIGAYAFSNCSGLESATIPSGVEAIGLSAFEGCGGLASVTISSGVRTIGRYAFAGCLGLQAVTIPFSVTNIGSRAFYYCNGLKTVTISEGVTSLGGYAFSNCSGLNSVAIPASVTAIGVNAFRGCIGLKDVAFRGDAPAVGSSAFANVASGCTATVWEGTAGWGSAATWNGLTLVRRTPVPDIGANATPAQVAEALSGSADPKLAANVATGADYASFRAWSGHVKDANGEPADARTVANAPNAWLSYALASETLIADAPADGDMQVETLETTADGALSLTVGIEGVTVGDQATEANLKKAFGLEGGTTLDGLTSDGVVLRFAEPEDGSVRFTAEPKDPGEASFFMKVRLR